MKTALEALKTTMVEELQKAGHPVEDKDVIQTLGCEDLRLFEQALSELCEEGRLTVTHEKPMKAKFYDAVCDFLTPYGVRTENRMRPLRMSEEERAGRAFQAAVEKGPDPKRRMLSIPS